MAIVAAAWIALASTAPAAWEPTAALSASWQPLSAPAAWESIDAASAPPVTGGIVTLAAAGTERPDSGVIANTGAAEAAIVQAAGIERPDGGALLATGVSVPVLVAAEGTEPADVGILSNTTLIIDPVLVSGAGAEPADSGGIDAVPVAIVSFEGLLSEAPDRGTARARSIGPPQLDAAQQAALLFDPPALKLPHETLVYPFDYEQDLLPGETIAEFMEMTVEAPGSLDPNPDQVRMGPPQVTPTALFQFASDGVNGVNYLISALVRTSRQRVLESEIVVRVREATGRPTRRT